MNKVFREEKELSKIFYNKNNKQMSDGQPLKEITILSDSDSECGDIDQDTISEEEEWMQEDYDWIEGEYSSSDASFSVEVEII